MNPLESAAAALRNGGLVAYPTEAVYGLGCDPANEDTVMRLLALKNRPVDKGLILIAARIDQLGRYIDIRRFRDYPHVLETWPGPHTWLMPCRDDTPTWLRGRFPTLAVRVTAHPLAAALCDAFGSALISTSANPGEQPPALDAEQVREYFPDGVDIILDGELGGRETVSSIRDAETGKQLR